MWFKQARTAARQGPEFWWRQLESSSRSGLPFAHLFPRPPTSRRPAPSEARQLISELVAAPPPAGVAELVHAYQRQPPARRWEPVEPWQIVSESPVDEAESAAWGADGHRVVTWFNQGELMAAWPTAPVPPRQLAPARRGLARLGAWLKSLILIPQSDSVAWKSHPLRTSRALGKPSRIPGGRGRPQESRAHRDCTTPGEISRLELASAEH